MSWIGPTNGQEYQNFGALTMILPYMEQTPIFNSINFAFGMCPFTPNTADAVQGTGTLAVINSFICPSDGTGKGRNNYRASNGTNWDWWSRDPGSGPLTRPQPGGQTIGTISGVTDGTSNTICFFERNRGSNNGSPRCRPIARRCLHRRPRIAVGYPHLRHLEPGGFRGFHEYGSSPTASSFARRQQNPTRAALDLWRAMVVRGRVHQLGREFQPDAQQQDPRLLGLGHARDRNRVLLGAELPPGRRQRRR